MNDIFEKMKKDEIKKLYKLVQNNSKKELLSEIEKLLFNKNMRFETANNIEEQNFLDKLYKNEIEKILFILSRKDLLKKVGGLKILISGETGTGKTTLVDLISKKIKNYKFIKISAESLLSPKMGQTQINILTLSQSLKNDKKEIIFIDEVDSIISNRNNENELMESHRITSSFLQFLDSFSENKIIIFATNIHEKIDKAIKRRMNFLINGKTFDITTILSQLKIETKFEITPQQKTTLISLYKNTSFNVAELNWFINEYEIIKEMGKIEKDYLFFIKKFENNATFSNIDISERMQKDLKKVGIKWQN